MEKGKMRANERGVVLMTALAVMLMLSILMSSIVFFVGLNQQTTHENYRENQAYLTASTTLESFIANIENTTANPTNDPAKLADQIKAIEDLEKLADANGGKGTTTNVQINGRTDNTENMGTCTITVAREAGSSTNIVVTCTANYLGEEQTVAAHIATQSKNKTADYTNTIEITGNGDATYDNLNVVGDMACIDESTGKVYNFTNNTTVYGSYLMQGSLKNDTKTRIGLRPSLTDPTKGTSVTISENLLNSSNDLTIDTTMIRGDGYNYVNVGQLLQLGGGHPKIGNLASDGTPLEIDVFCSKLEMTSNSYEQYGNLYCYKTNSIYDGSFYIKPNGGDFIVHGDLFVEGNLTVDADTVRLKVDGNIYVAAGSTITGKDRIQCGGEIFDNATFSKAGRDSRPELPLKTNEYVYFPEDFFVSNDPGISTIKNKYLGFYDGTITKTVGSILNASSGDVVVKDKADINNDGVEEDVESHYVAKITESCKFTSSNIDKLKNGGKLLVEVTDASKDIVIMLQGGLSLGSEWSPAIIVRNTSEFNEATREHKYNCYIVSDSGKDIQLTGLDASGKSQHTGSTACDIKIEKFMVLDYNTYIRMYESSELLASKSALAAVTPKNTFILNSSEVDLPNAYRPERGNIVFLLGEGTTFTAPNAGLIQASVYAPQANWIIETNGVSLNVADSTGNTMTVGESGNTLGVLHIGVVIAGKFNNKNTAFYVFQKPSSTSMLAAAKGAKDDTATGYTLNRYDHY